MLRKKGKCLLVHLHENRIIRQRRASGIDPEIGFAIIGDVAYQLAQAVAPIAGVAVFGVAKNQRSHFFFKHL